MHSGTYWDNIGELPARNYRCGYPSCGREISADRGWVHRWRSPTHGTIEIDGTIYACPNCKRPTFFDGAVQFPGTALGSEVEHLPPEIASIWAEIRTCTGHSAFTSAVLAGRKLLMHISVNQGAQPGLSFVQYVNHLVDNHYAPPNSKPWIDKIRDHGNEANHEIVIKKKEDAEEIMIFLEMLLKFIYEFPGRVPPPPP